MKIKGISHHCLICLLNVVKKLMIRALTDILHDVGDCVKPRAGAMSGVLILLFTGKAPRRGAADFAQIFIFGSASGAERRRVKRKTAAYLPAKPVRQSTG